jgi:hypothetical protein
MDESWPTGGVPANLYSRQKAEVERRLDRLEAVAPGLRVVRLRPALVFSRAAASETRRLFAGPLPRFGPWGASRWCPTPASASRSCTSTTSARRSGSALSETPVAPTTSRRSRCSTAAGSPPRSVGALCASRPPCCGGGRGDPVPAPAADASGTGSTSVARCRSWTPHARGRSSHGRHGAAPRRPWRSSSRGCGEGAGHPTPPLEPHAGGPARVWVFLTGVGSRERR